METPRIALAPRRLFVGVPSRAIIFLVERSLVELDAGHLPCNFAVDVGHSGQHALTEIAQSIAVSQFERLPLSRRSARRNGRAAERSALETHFDFHCWISTRVQNFSSVHGVNVQGLSPVVFGFDAKRVFADWFNKGSSSTVTTTTPSSVTVCRLRLLRG